MRGALVLSALLAMGLAAPAQAQFEPAKVVRFAPGQQTPFDQDGAFFSGECSGVPVQPSGGWDGGPYFREPCGFLTIDFPFQRQAMVELFVRATGGDTIVDACVNSDGCGLIVRQTVDANTGWQPVVLADPKYAATIDFIQINSRGTNVDIDDVSFSPVRQPDTRITAAPDTLVEGATGSIVSEASTPLASILCSLDGTAFAACSNPLSVVGTSLGQHTVAVKAVDVYGEEDPSPVSVTFNVVPAPVVLPAPADGDFDGVPDAGDNCPAAANTDQADADADAVGNACELLEPGNKPLVAGVNTVVRQISGEVFVKLPVPNRLGFRGMRAPFQDSGFISLKGVASVPVGSTVDTRKGEIGLESAANGFAASDRRARRQSARIKAGLFAIKQARARRRVAKAARIPTDIDLLSPPRAEAACVRGPAKGVVRTMSMTAKGFIRALGGASTATARDATFNTTDRCDGTVTEVGRGRVSLAVKGQRKPITVRAGRAYLVKAKIFAVRKGRRKPGVN